MHLDVSRSDYGGNTSHISFYFLKVFTAGVVAFGGVLSLIDA
jgi:hypothetical protein